MLYKDIVKNFNVLLAGDNLVLKDILPHLDFALDKVNEKLNTCYPTFTEYYDPNGDYKSDKYDLFENRFIRQVILPGAAWHYYVTDEEGLATSPQYEKDFENGLFVMQRDMLYNIPVEWQASNEQGTVRAARDHWNLGERGLVATDPILL